MAGKWIWWQQSHGIKSHLDVSWTPAKTTCVSAVGASLAANSQATNANARKDIQENTVIEVSPTKRAGICPRQLPLYCIMHKYYSHVLCTQYVCICSHHLPAICIVYNPIDGNCFCVCVWPVCVPHVKYADMLHFLEQSL